MRDLAFTLLFNEFAQSPKPALWLVDENLNANTLPEPVTGVQALTNRFDLFTALKAKGWPCNFNDYQPQEEGYNSWLLRIPKEKAQAHYLINQACEQLAKQKGTLILTGLKQEGIKGFIDRASALASDCERWKADKQTFAAALTFHSPATEQLDDKHYTLLRQAPQDEYFHFFSKPGIFGWDKIDQGSQLLIEHLPALLPTGFSPATTLDLGCGYGYLSLHCHRLLGCQITATDNNAAAIAACQQNLLHYQLPGTAVADDCASNIQQRFDLVICNPPFHAGFATTADLTSRFLQASAKHLQPNGIALFVTNLHIPLERKAQSFFKQCNTISTDHFKLICLSQPV